MFKNNYRRVLAYAPLLLLGSRLPLIKMLEHPAANLKRWDQRGAQAPPSPATSARTRTSITGGSSRSSGFTSWSTRRPRDGRTRPAEEARIWDALRHGRFYNAVEAVADASGFRFEALKRAGAQGAGGRRRAALSGWAIRSRSRGRAERPVLFEIRAPFRFRKEIRLLRDGRVIASSRDDVARASRPRARASTGSRSTSRSGRRSGRTSRGSSPTPST